MHDERRHAGILTDGDTFVSAIAMLRAIVPRDNPARVAASSRACASRIALRTSPGRLVDVSTIKSYTLCKNDFISKPKPLSSNIPLSICNDLAVCRVPLYLLCFGRFDMPHAA